MLSQLPHVKAQAYRLRSCAPMLAIGFLILRSPGDLEYEAFTPDGVNLGDVGGRLSGVQEAGASIHPAAEDGLGEGARLIAAGGDLLTVDFLGPDLSGLSIYTYTPESPWIVTNGQQVGGSYFWFEWQEVDDSPSTLIRLMRSDSAKLTVPQEVQTVTVETTILSFADWRSARGPDFTTVAGGLWLETNNEQGFWERIVIPLAGGVSTQRASAVETDFLESVRRAGYPAGASLSITQTSDQFVSGGESLPLVTWGGGAEDDYQPWASVGEAIAIAPDPVSGLWVLRDDPNVLEHFSSAGSLLETVELEVGFADAVGLHVLAEPIPWIEPGGEEE